MNLYLGLAENVILKLYPNLWGVDIPDQYKSSRRPRKLTSIEPKYIDCCMNNCIVFTGEHVNASECPLCGEERFLDINSRRPQKTFVYIPLILG